MNKQELLNDLKALLEKHNCYINIVNAGNGPFDLPELEIVDFNTNEKITCEGYLHTDNVKESLQ